MGTCPPQCVHMPNQASSTNQIAIPGEQKENEELRRRFESSKIDLLNLCRTSRFIRVVDEEVPRGRKGVCGEEEDQQFGTEK
ncbi:hypothetical protein R1flu_015157 [Riccia fluitans]|uniref:Uncharacterized protein n=1 Tax=Riccia fluitans TaxID=41844 RepID=A0ABD1YIJ8_9MARC